MIIVGYMYNYTLECINGKYMYMYIVIWFNIVSLFIGGGFGKKGIHPHLYVAIAVAANK